MIPIILSYREGCSGSWLGEILNCCKFDDNFTVNFRQDVNGVPVSVYHFNGHRNDQNNNTVLYNNQPFITCHVDQFDILKNKWPNSVVYRIIPKTYVLDAIAAAWYKIKPKQSATIDDAFEYIKNYYHLHTVADPQFGTVIDYGNLRNIEWVKSFVKLNNISYNSKCDKFILDYWQLQKKSNLKEISAGLSMEKIINTIDMTRDIFYIALAIFVYEQSNNLQESQRLWSINNITVDTNLLSLSYS